jgi:hypothetical protein
MHSGSTALQSVGSDDGSAPQSEHDSEWSAGSRCTGEACGVDEQYCDACWEKWLNSSTLAHTAQLCTHASYITLLARRCG